MSGDSRPESGHANHAAAEIDMHFPGYARVQIRPQESLCVANFLRRLVGPQRRTGVALAMLGMGELLAMERVLTMPERTRVCLA